MHCALVVLLLVGCSSSPAPRDPMIARICQSAPCTGRLAQIHVWRTSGGDVGRYVYDGDLTACSHPPRVYFDPAGAQSFAVPFEPVVPGSPEAEALSAQQRAQTDGLTEAENTACE